MVRKLRDAGSSQRLATVDGGSPALAQRNDEKIGEKEPPEGQLSRQPVTACGRALVIECREQLGLEPAAKRGRVKTKQGAVDRPHTSPLRSRGFARAASTMALSWRTS
jgi:hypothetical protein